MACSKSIWGQHRDRTLRGLSTFSGPSEFPKLNRGKSSDLLERCTSIFIVSHVPVKEMEEAFHIEPWQEKLYSYLPTVWILQAPMSNWWPSPKLHWSISWIIPKCICPPILTVTTLMEALITSCLDAPGGFWPELLQIMLPGLAREMAPNHKPDLVSSGLE